MHDPVQITVLEEEKVAGLLPRELAQLSSQACWLMALGFLVAAAVSHIWWFAFGTALAGVIGWYLQSLASYLRDLAYANSDLVDPGVDEPRAD